MDPEDLEESLKKRKKSKVIAKGRKEGDPKGQETEGKEGQQEGPGGKGHAKSF
jgi:hypothetical protein